jgi:hypothetical protein
MTSSSSRATIGVHAPEETTMDDETKSTTDPNDSAPGGGPKATAENVLETLREAVDDIAERAAPTVRELSARAAELTAAAAVKAAPLVKRAGEVTADASTKLAEKSRGWAADLRSGVGAGTAGDEPTPSEAGAAGEPDPSDLAAWDATQPSDAGDPAPFETTAEAGADASPTYDDER